MTNDEKVSVCRALWRDRERTRLELERAEKALRAAWLKFGDEIRHCALLDGAEPKNLEVVR